MECPPRLLTCRTDVRGELLLLLPLTALASSTKKRITRSRKGRARMGILIVILVLLLCFNLTGLVTFVNTLTMEGIDFIS